ncbi:protein kinase domain-containing protein [Tundrisphaera lichenicola]|uniref:serine/threonine-protein kinase n=1 Tax=Tundrisphaera lichenicola TaxID=2029860 RepID=UPI003EBDAAD8
MPRIGEEFLGFQLIGELGSGAFGKVFLARQGDLADRPVALKISTDIADEPQKLAQLQHTNIVPIYSIHRIDSLQAVCMPYFGSTTLRNICEDLRTHGKMPASGQDLLSSLLDRRQEADGASDRGVKTQFTSTSTVQSSDELPLEFAFRSKASCSTDTLRHLERLTYVQAVLWLIARLGAGLSHAHERGIIHRDVKPANILITDEGQPMLLDFNLAADFKLKSNSAAAVGGTLAYMSPEQLEDYMGVARTVDTRSDLYSLGIVFFELLAGERPFELEAGQPGTVVQRLLEARLASVPDVRLWNKSVSPAVESILRHCLESDPGRRYQEARHLLDDLERQLANRPLRYASDPSARERLSKWARRHPTLSSTTSLIVMALLLFSSLGAAGLWMFRELERAKAIIQHAEFRATFDECHFLLNTTGGPPGQLDQGILLADRAIGGYIDYGPEGRIFLRLSRSLPLSERKDVREELSELIQLTVRARTLRFQQLPKQAGQTRILSEGVTWLDLAVEIDPRPSATLFEDRARLLENLGKADRASRDHSMAARIMPSDARDYYLLGVSALASHHFDLAELCLSRSIALDGRRFWSWFALGTCHFDQSRFGDASSEFGVCSTLAPKFSWPHLNRGIALARLGRLAEARIAYDRCLELSPDFVEARVNRALACLELGEADEALEDLDWAIKLGHRSVSILIARSEALAHLQDRPGAERSFREVIASAPSDAMPLVARGHFRIEVDPSGARSDFDEALRIDPNNARARLGLAYVLRDKDPGSAIEQLNLALAVDPDLWDAVQLRALLKARFGDLAAEFDVQRLLQVPTPLRLHNSACALSQLTKANRDPRLIDRAIELVRRALDSGLPPAIPASDPDLDPLRTSPSFRSLMDQQLSDESG